MFDGDQATGSPRVATRQVGCGGPDAALARARAWADRRTFRYADKSSEAFAELKRSAEATVSVVIPAKSVAGTIGEIVACCVRMRAAGAVDEVIVIDASTSGDGTAEIAAQAGATVHREDALLAGFGPVLGKGDAIWRAQSVVAGDIVVYVDGDSERFDEGFVTGLAEPLLGNVSLRHVKGAFRRPFTDSGVRVADGGGRVSELTARPLLNLFFPELSAVQQPLAGEFASRREALARMPFLTGYGAEIQLLLDFYREYGLDAIAQSDLGERINRHQPLHDLGAMSFTIARAILSRVDDEHGLEGHHEFVNYVEGEPVQRAVPLVERPPYARVRAKGANGA